MESSRSGHEKIQKNMLPHSKRIECLFRLKVKKKMCSPKSNGKTAIAARDRSKVYIIQVGSIEYAIM